MSEAKVDVTKKYSREIQDMANKLRDLEQGRIYELTQARMDGYLATNINQLREMIIDLIRKIEYGKESINDRLYEIFNNGNDSK